MKTKARMRVVDAKDEWELLAQMLPDQWQQKARELGAVRRLRGVGDVATLLRILLLHLVDGCSLKETALRAEQAGWGKVSSVALFKRLRSAEHWLAWMARQLWDRRLPEGQERCLAVDATTIRESGKTGSCWKVHWCVNLASLQCEFFELTDDRGGEKLARFPIERGDLILGDRGYSNPAGVDWVCRHGGDVLVRLNPQSLPLFTRKNGEKIDVLTRVRSLRLRQVRSWPAWAKGPEGHWHAGRLVAVRRSRASVNRELRRWKRNSKTGQRHLSRQIRAQMRYVLIWTSAPAARLSKHQVLRRYRCRWQLELIFKRAKSIMGLGQLPKQSDASSRAWLNGKLLVAMLVEKLWRQAEAVSPWGYPLGPASKPLA